MLVDLFKLNNFNHLDIDSDVEIPENLYENMDIRNILDVHVSGELEIDLVDEVEANLSVTGTFILPCAVTLEDVEYQFSTKIEENLGKFENFYNKNKNTLDILPILWENIVSEVPIRVVKEGVENTLVNGEGWELVSSE